MQNHKCASGECDKPQNSGPGHSRSAGHDLIPQPELKGQHVPLEPLQAVLPGSVGSPLHNNRILVIDDNPSIHDDFRKVLGGHSEPQTDLMSAEAVLFGPESVPAVS